jgi:hypothetical protein
MQQQPPRPKKQRAKFSEQSRPVQIISIIVTLAIIGLCLFCSIGLITSVLGGSHPNTANAGNTPAVTSAPVTPSPTSKPQVWTTVKTFTGNGNKKTATFTAPDHWKLVWSCDPTSFDNISYNVIVDVDNDSGPVDLGAVNTLCAKDNKTGETEERQGGQLYLDVTSEAKWTIQIQVLK